VKTWDIPDILTDVLLNVLNLLTPAGDRWSLLVVDGY
jgi:hypothetical protein